MNSVVHEFKFAKKDCSQVETKWKHLRRNSYSPVNDFGMSQIQVLNFVGHEFKFCPAKNFTKMFVHKQKQLEKSCKQPRNLRLWSLTKNSTSSTDD